MAPSPVLDSRPLPPCLHPALLFYNLVPLPACILHTSSQAVGEMSSVRRTSAFPRIPRAFFGASYIVPQLSWPHLSPPPVPDPSAERTVTPASRLTVPGLTRNASPYRCTLLPSCLTSRRLISIGRRRRAPTADEDADAGGHRQGRRFYNSRSRAYAAANPNHDRL
ncbi:hypothetical protein MVEN_01975600 [Mycena venus]|uniref:Uncharacterized protein n=1 Tax=Mycena venus TaxID=2733690 RepID=A0A8H7CIJ7_9AGAR|nr:hypothetical protein MVEN_01975600 [Mycena venus]